MGARVEQINAVFKFENDGNKYVLHHFTILCKTCASIDCDEYFCQKQYALEKFTSKCCTINYYNNNRTMECYKENDHLYKYKLYKLAGFCLFHTHVNLKGNIK